VQWQQVLHSLLSCKALSLKSDAGCQVKYNFFLHDFALRLLEIYNTFLIYVIIFGLIKFGIDNLTSAGG
jgi:hypothetical protein